MVIDRLAQLSSFETPLKAFARVSLHIVQREGLEFSRL